MSKISKNSFPKLDKPVAIHLHLYYTDMWDELSEELQNMDGTPYHLYVTLVEKNELLEKKIKKFCSTAHILIIKNMGYDIGPFIEFLNLIDLNEYSYILKLHSKRPTGGKDTHLNNLPVSRKYWKILLSQGLIGTKKIWYENLQAFATDQQLGMIASPYLIKKADKSDAILQSALLEQFNKLKLTPPETYSFVAGTMFIARSEIFKILQHQYCIEDFSLTDSKIKDGTMAHVFERLLGAIVETQGYTIKGFAHHYRFMCNAIGKLILRFFYQKKVTNKNLLLVKICRIPMMRKKI